MKFGDNLRKIRKSKKMSQEQLAEKVNVTRQSVSKWENGESYPEMNNILELCKIFNCKLNDLVHTDMADISSLDEEIVMKVVKSLIIILLFLMPMQIFSQTVSATFFNLPQQKVYLYACSGLSMELLDSVMMTHDKRVEFNTPLKKGMYQIETEYGAALDFLYDDSPVRFVVKDFYDLSSVEFINSQLNTDWYAYQLLKERTFESLALLKPLLRAYNTQSEFYIDTKKEYQDIQDKFISFTDSLMLNGNYASNLIKVDRFLPINLDDDMEKQRKDLIANFFNDVDFNDLSLIATDI